MNWYAPVASVSATTPNPEPGLYSATGTLGMPVPGTEENVGS
ncbi:MAG: hypothetical protein RR396_03485 [Clostridiales bacterium]